MQPTAARSSRSSIIYPVAPLTSAYVPQPQRIVYAPITAIQANNRHIQPNYIYRNQKTICQVATMQNESKLNVWPVKRKVVKAEPYCQHQFVHPSNPVMVYKQPLNHFYPIGPNASFVLSSNVSSNPYTEHYGQPNVTMLSQPFYKSSEFQQINPIYANQSQLNSYYMPASNATNLPTINLNSNFEQFKSVTMNNSMPVVQNVSTYPNMQIGLAINESSSEKVDQTYKMMNNDKVWLSETINVSSEVKSDETNGPSMTQSLMNHDDHMSEASSNSFDFTIEAEKMVSTLCDMKTTKPLESEDNVEQCEKNESSWFLDLNDTANDDADDVPTNKSVSTQMPEINSNEHLSELTRRMALWGCTEAEIILKSARYSQDSKYIWLTNLSAATKTAITKSSTSYPIFGGDRILVHDLINALLRISNGWLALDNYLNKQYHPSLNEKYDLELHRCFQSWENATHDLLKSIVQTCQKIEKSSSFFDPEQKPELLNRSFPGDVSMYTRCDLFDPLATHRVQQPAESYVQPTYLSTYFSPTPNFHYISCQQNINDSKLRTKWTIADNPPSTPQRPAASRKSRSSVCFQQSLNAEFCHLRNKVMKSKQGNDPEFTFFNRSTFAEDSSTSIDSSKAYQATASSLTNHMPSFTDSNLKPNLNVRSKVPEDDSVFKFGTSFGSGLVAKPKMTLLSEIEPKVTEKLTIKQDMASHLSAWFANMKSQSVESNQIERNCRVSCNGQIDITKNSLDLSKQLKMDTNMQLLTLKNMQSIQSAPWSAYSLLNSTKRRQPKGLDDCESTEDFRVYMKPGSYNVPKKRHQKKSKNFQLISKTNNRLHKSLSFENKHGDNIASAFPTLSSITNSPTANLMSLDHSKESLKNEKTELADDSPEILESKESTWKAACASAEILLEALTINKKDDNCSNIEDDITSAKSDMKNQKSNDKIPLKEPSSENLKDENLVVNQNCVKSGKHNVKTDSWLLKTLRKKGVEQKDVPKTETNFQLVYNKEQNVLESRQLTYSDMTRKEYVKASKVASGINNDDNRRNMIKRSLKNHQLAKNDERMNKLKMDADDEKRLQADHFQLKKRRKVKTKEGLLYLNAKKKFALDHFSLNKLESIYRIICQMKESDLLRSPSSSEVDASMMINEYHKSVKQSTNLETIAYKLKCRTYSKSEHFLSDFRKVVQNSRSYYKNDENMISKIDTISEKLDKLFEEYFIKSPAVNLDKQD